MRCWWPGCCCVPVCGNVCGTARLVACALLRVVGCGPSCHCGKPGVIRVLPLAVPTCQRRVCCCALAAASQTCITSVSVCVLPAFPHSVLVWRCGGVSVVRAPALALPRSLPVGLVRQSPCNHLAASRSCISLLLQQARDRHHDPCITATHACITARPARRRRSWLQPAGRAAPPAAAERAL